MATSNRNPSAFSSGQQCLSAWFDFFDRDRNGTLDREEVVHGLQHTMAQKGSPMDPQVLRHTVYSVWPLFDRDGNGVVDRSEFCANGGLGERLVAMVNSSGGGGVGGAYGTAPPPVQHPQQPYGAGGYTPMANMYGHPAAPTASYPKR